ncbi:hypothetical protein KKB18_06560, partial [bacterium]|nr:hypothetical protein [bacterium]
MPEKDPLAFALEVLELKINRFKKQASLPDKRCTEVDGFTLHADIRVHDIKRYHGFFFRDIIFCCYLYLSGFNEICKSTSSGNGFFSWKNGSIPLSICCFNEGDRAWKNKVLKNMNKGNYLFFAILPLFLLLMGMQQQNPREFHLGLETI